MWVRSAAHRHSTFRRIFGGKNLRTRSDALQTATTIELPTKPTGFISVADAASMRTTALHEKQRTSTAYRISPQRPPTPSAAKIDDN
jgi:hypothetical protein